jgi:hypothetical protein
MLNTTLHFIYCHNPHLKYQLTINSEKDR